MLKKTLLAAAVASVVSVPAFAKVVISDKGTNAWQTTVLASVTKQPVLSFSTSSQDVEATFDQTGDLKQNGFVTLEIRGNGTFNASEVRQWLTKDAGAYPGITVALKSADNDKAITSDVDITDVEALFKTGTFGTDTIIEHAIDLDGKRLRLALKENPSDTAAGPALDDNLILIAEGAEAADAADNRFAAAGSTVKFNLTNANQAFNLVSGSQVSIPVAVGALRNASYTADPVSTDPLFTLNKLFDLERTVDVKTAEAKVKYAYSKFGSTDADNTLAYSADQVKLRNLTSNQNLNLDKVILKLEGMDLSAFKVDESGNLLNMAGAQTGLKLSTDGKSATAKAGDTVIEGDLDSSGKPTGQAVVNIGAFTQLAIDSANTKDINAQTIKLSATILGNSQDTFNDFTSNLLDLYFVTRDGLKFDTITTGSTSANTIHIRDISNSLPEVGGKIYVTIVEYDAHGLDQNAEGNVLVERKELSLKLPSGGAVTLSPAGVAADVGAAINPARQARFVFEVETNIGEVAVKKQTSEGIDIQNGSQAPDAGVVDFTL